MKPTPFVFELGQVVTDIVTGFTGIVRNRTQYLTGCNTYGVQSQELKDGKPADWVYFDEHLLKTENKHLEFSTPAEVVRRGGPLNANQQAPQR